MSEEIVWLWGETVGGRIDAEIDKEAEKPVPWAEFIKGGKRVKHVYKK